MRTYTAATDIEVITSDIAIPGLGLVPVNAFVLRGNEPILVDTGTVAERDEFMETLRSVIDPAELRWIWLTHTDFDHIGSLHTLLAEYPAIRVATTFLAVGIMGLADPLPLDRLYLINPGQELRIGERRLQAFKPPAFDNPSTTGFFEASSGTLFSADSFGALLQEVPDRASDLTDEQLREGQIFWATLDSPWLQWVDERAFARRLDEVRALEPEMVLSSHLPAAGKDQTERLLASLSAAPKADPFVGMDQTALEQMLAEMTGDASA